MTIFRCWWPTIAAEYQYPEKVPNIIISPVSSYHSYHFQVTNTRFSTIWLLSMIDMKPLRHHKNVILAQIYLGINYAIYRLYKIAYMILDKIEWTIYKIDCPSIVSYWIIQGCDMRRFDAVRVSSTIKYAQYADFSFVFNI